MSEIYNSVSVPHGARSETVFNSDLTGLGVYKFENFTITRPATVIERKEVDASAKDWVAVRNYPTMTCTVQIPLTASDWPPQGAFILDTFDLPVEEKWAIVEVAPGLVMGDYHKVNVTLRGDIGYVGTAHYPLTANANDASLGGNNLTLFGNAVITGGALALDGSGDYASHVSSSAYNAGDKDFSILFFIKAAAHVESDRFIVEKFTGGIGYKAKLLITTGKLAVTLNSTTASLAGDTVDDDGWHHIGIVRSGASLLIYLDAALESTTATTTASLDNSAAFMIGQDGASGNYFQGSIKAVRFFKRAISAEENNYFFSQDN